MSFWWGASTTKLKNKARQMIANLDGDVVWSSFDHYKIISIPLVGADLRWPAGDGGKGVQGGEPP